MKNAEKIMTALKKAFPGHKVENSFIEENYNMESIFVDEKCIGLFYEDFFQKDFDNPGLSEEQ